MKIGVLSDLYVDELGALPTPPEQPDILVLAGNVGQGTRGLEWAQAAYSCPIIYVCGPYSYREQNIDTLDSELRSRSWGSHVKMLQNETLVVRGIRFIGSTLWTDFNLHGDPDTAMLLAEEGSPDFKRIRRSDGETIRPVDIVARHRKAVDFLEQEATKHYEDGRTVIITHHAPSSKSVPPRYRDDMYAACCASHLDGLVERVDAAVWIHGSQHDSADYMLGRTRVVANPRGFPREQREVAPFKPNYFVELY